MLACPLYINSIASIQPSAGEPDYKELIPNASVRRRMSRLVRMGVAAGLQCLKKAPDIRPDAILTATGLGFLTDTEKFMDNLLDMDEQLLPPTAFIQSTFNTIGAQIALLTGNHGYNNTYVHRGHSLESALMDASLLIAEGEARHVLVGAMDEMTPTLHAILERFGCWRKATPGEGAAFSLLSKERSDQSIAVLQDMELFSGSFSADEIKGRMASFLADNKVERSAILTPEKYKPFCGEYPTAVGFALEYACRPETPGHTLVYQSFLGDHSFILINRL